MNHASDPLMRRESIGSVMSQLDDSWVAGEMILWTKLPRCLHEIKHFYGSMGKSAYHCRTVKGKEAT